MYARVVFDQLTWRLGNCYITTAEPDDKTSERLTRKRATNDNIH